MTTIHRGRFSATTEDDFVVFLIGMRFNKAVNDSGDVGIWHETYQVQAGRFEAVYGNMPTFGLAEGIRTRPRFQDRPVSSETNQGIRGRHHRCRSPLTVYVSRPQFQQVNETSEIGSSNPLIWRRPAGSNATPGQSSANSGVANNSHGTAMSPIRDARFTTLP